MCVLNNGDLNMVTWEMRAFEGPEIRGVPGCPIVPNTPNSPR